MPEIELKPDQERVKNLLTDTVTLLCRNSLTFRDRLRIEGLLGVSIDNSDVFFVHISENFEQNSSEKAPAEDAEASMFTAPESPAKPSRRPRESPCPSPSRQSQLSPASSPAQVKSEPAEDVDDLLIVEEPKPEVFADRARQTSMVAGQRRAARRREHSPLVQHHQGGWDDMGEPAAKRHMSTDSDSENNGGGQGSGFGQVDENVGWPDMVTDFNQGHMFHQDPGGSSFDTTTPGCSTWPTTLATQQQTQDTITSPSDSGPRFPQGNASKKVREILWETIVAPLTENPVTRIMAFRLVWSRKDVVEEDVWARMAQYRHHMDNMMMNVQGPSFFISSISANVSHQGKNQNVVPCLGYYVVVDDAAFVESTLYIPMRENPFGAVLKLVSLPTTEKEDRRLQMLSKLVKDYGEGYVRRKMDHYVQKHEPLIMTYIHNERYQMGLSSAACVLRDSVGLHMELKTY